MEPDDLRSPLRRGIAAALEGLTEVPAQAAHDAAASLFVLQNFGDALRASLDLPGPLRRWMRALRDDDACAAIATATEEVSRWASSASDESFPFALCRRDQIASALYALDWRFLVSSPGVELQRSVADLERALARYDASLTASRSEAESLLEERAYLADRGWRAGLRDDREVDEALLPDTLPSDAIVDAWLREGRFHRSVESAASRDPDFTEDLAFLVAAALQDARRDPTLPVSFVARRWNQRSAGSVRVEVPSDPTVLAASSDDAAAEPTSVSLGLLAPLEAHASIDLVDGQATLTVHAEPGIVSRLVVGDRDVEPDAHGTCRIAFSTALEAVAVVVRGSDITVVSFDLSFPPRLDG